MLVKFVPEGASWYHLGQDKSASATLKMNEPDVLLANNLHASVQYTEVTKKWCTKEIKLHLNFAAWRTRAASVASHSNKQIVLMVCPIRGEATDESSSESVIAIRTRSYSREVIWWRKAFTREKNPLQQAWHMAFSWLFKESGLNTVLSSVKLVIGLIYVPSAWAGLPS